MMDKSEIISTTLDELLEKFHSNPEAFQYMNSESSTRPNWWTPPCLETISWQTKVSIEDKLTADPTSYQRSILVTYTQIDQSMTVRIYNQTFDKLSFIEQTPADGTIHSKKLFKRYRKNYRKFVELRKLIAAQKEKKDTKEFITKLSSVFPAMLDHFILGK